MNDEDLLREVLHQHAEGVDGHIDAGHLSERLQRADRNTMIARVGFGAAAVVLVAIIAVATLGRTGEGATELNTATTGAEARLVTTTAAPPVTVPGPPGTGDTVPGDEGDPAAPGDPTDTTPVAPSTSTTSSVAATPQQPQQQPPVSNPAQQPTSPTVSTAPTSVKPTTTTMPATGCQLDISPKVVSTTTFTIDFVGHVLQPNAKVGIGLVDPKDHIVSNGGNVLEIQANASGDFSYSLQGTSTEIGTFRAKYQGGGCGLSPVSFTKTA